MKAFLGAGTRDFSCPICNGDGKIKRDSRFATCRRINDVRFDGKSFVGFLEMLESASFEMSERGVWYSCNEGHPIGYYVSVDDYDKGNIIEKYTKAGWETKLADEAAKLEKKKQEEAQAKQEAERVREEAEREVEKEKLARRVMEQQRMEKDRAGRLGTFTDSRDGRTYKTAKMPDGKTWMGENLSYEYKPKKGSWCNENNETNCKTYGRLYDWKTAMKVCPNNWRLPTQNDWNDLVPAAGGEGDAGKALKSVSGWEEGRYNIEGIDRYGFSALPGGYRDSKGNFFAPGKSNSGGYWWGAAEYGSYAYNLLMDEKRASWAYQTNVNYGTNDKRFGFSVRCVKDN